MAEKNYNEMAVQILNALGGKDNITFVTHCVTRLRLNLKDKHVPDEAVIKNIPGVLGCTWSGEQFQVIIGQSVKDVYNAFCKAGGFEKPDTAAKSDTVVEKKKFSTDLLFDALSGCVTPVIPVLVGCGLIKIILLLCELTHILSADMPTHMILSFVGDAGFYFLPIFVGFTAANKFGATPLMGALMGAILIHPDFTSLVTEGTTLSFLGLPVMAGSYANMIFPSIISVYVMSKIQRFIGKHSPEAVRAVTEPLFTLLIMIPILLCVTGPVGLYIGNLVTASIMWLYDTLGFAGVAVLAGIFPFMILMGMHPCIGTYAVQSFSALGYDPVVLTANFCANLAMGASCLGVALKAKKAETKSIGFSFALSAILSGVTEPALFGMLTKVRSSMIAACIGAVAGGCVGGFFKVSAYAFPGSGGLLGLPCFVGQEGMNFIMAVVSVVVSMIVALIVSYFTYKEDAN